MLVARLIKEAKVDSKMVIIHFNTYEGHRREMTLKRFQCHYEPDFDFMLNTKRVALLAHQTREEKNKDSSSNKWASLQMNHITIKDYYIGCSLVELEIQKDMLQGYQLSGKLVHVKDLRRYIRQNSPALVYRNRRVYRREP